MPEVTDNRNDVDRALSDSIRSKLGTRGLAAESLSEQEWRYLYDKHVAFMTALLAQHHASQGVDAGECHVHPSEPMIFPEFKLSILHDGPVKQQQRIEDYLDGFEAYDQLNAERAQELIARHRAAQRAAQRELFQQGEIPLVCS